VAVAASTVAIASTAAIAGAIATIVLRAVRATMPTPRSRS